MKKSTICFIGASISLFISVIAYAAQWGAQGQAVSTPAAVQSSISTLTTNSATKVTFGTYTSKMNRRSTVVFAAFSTLLKAKGTW